MCDGSEYSRTTYSKLFAVTGTSFGVGDNSTTFNVPDLRGNVPVGVDSSYAPLDSLGKTTGAKTHTLSESEIPSHNHSMAHTHNTGGNGNFVATAAGGTGFQNGTYWNRTSMANTGPSSAANTGNKGGGGAHNNMQPSLGINYIIRAL